MLGVLEIVNYTIANYSSPYASLFGGSSAAETVFLIVIAAFLTFRVYNGVKGMKFRHYRIYFLPAVYLILTIYSLAILNPTYLDAAAVAISIIAGCLIGLRLGGGVHFFDKNGAVYYKRSPFIMICWLVSYIARLVIGLAFPTNLILGLIIEIVLALTTGMIIGEAFHIYNNYKIYKKSEEAKLQHKLD